MEKSDIVEALKRLVKASDESGVTSLFIYPDDYKDRQCEMGYALEHAKEVLKNEV